MTETQIHNESNVQESVQYVSLHDRYVQFFEQVVNEIKECRRLTSTTQSELASDLSIDRRKLIEFEAGTKRDIDLLIVLCEYYDINVCLFMETSLRPEQ